MGYRKISIKRKIVCAGDLRFKIDIGSRELSATNTGTPQFAFTVLKSPFAMIDTAEPDDNFDGISTSTDSVTHIFYVRHITAFDVDMKHVIRFNGNYYKVLKAMNSEESNLIDIIYCSHKGLVTKPAVDW